MNSIRLKTFTRSKNAIGYIKDTSGYSVVWGKTKFLIYHTTIDDILNDYFVSFEAWYPLGASMTNPTPGGLGEYIGENIKNLTPRHASAIARIMENEEFLEHKKEGSAIFLKKIVDKT